MKIGIAYDTRTMYKSSKYLDVHYDFAEEASIFALKTELEKIGHQVILLGNTTQIIKLLKDDYIPCDIVYNTVEGITSRNREGFLPSILELNNVPYIGTDSFGLSLTLNKYLTKIIAQYYNILTPNACLISYPFVEEKDMIALEGMRFPIIIKPNYEGNSSGICVCQNIEEAKHQIFRLTNLFHTDLLCEEFIYGKEITVPLIGNTSDEQLWDVTTVDVQKTDDFWLDINWKIYGDYKNVILNLPNDIKAQFEYAITTLFKVIGCRDFCRFDFRLSTAGEVYFIEANPLPALFKGGAFDILGQKYGYTYGETLQLIINTACNRLSIPKI